MADRERTRIPRIRQSPEPPIAPLQAAQWYTARLEPASATGHVCRAYRLTGSLDVAALQAAWRHLARRHPALRTRFPDEAGIPEARLVDDHDPLSVVDLTAAPDGVAGVAAWVAGRPFDLAAAPPVRLTVLRTGRAEQVFVLVLHRIVADERSVPALLAELSTWYAAALGEGTATAALPATAGFRAAQPSARLRADAGPAAVPPPLALPADRTRPAGPAPAAGVVPFDWRGDPGLPLAGFARDAGTTPARVLLAAFLVLLHRHSGQDRLPVGLPVPVGPGAGPDPAIGPFTNVVVLTADLGGQPDFATVVARVDEAAREALARREVPFADVVRAVAPDRDPRRTPLHDVTFTAIEPEPGPRFVGLTAEPVPVHRGALATDLALSADGTPSGFLEYRTALFDAETARTLVAQLHTLLVAAIAEPGREVAALPLDDEAVRSAIARESDRIADGPPAGAPLDHAVARRAAGTPAAPAVVFEGESVTYGELDALTNAITARLRAAGVRPGAAVAVRVSAGARRYAAVLAVFRAGAHVVWFGTGDAGERGRSVLDDLRPVCLVLDADPATDPLAGWFRSARDGRIVDVTSLEPLPAATAVPEEPAALTDLAYVAYTSGSTGRPKGIPQTHGALVQFGGWLAEEFRIGPGARLAQWVTPEHDPAITEVAAAFLGGATLYPLTELLRAHPEKLARWLAAERITHLQTVPSFAREVLRAIEELPVDGRPALDHLLLMGEAVTGELVERLRAALPATRIVNIYGPTETVAGTWHEATAPDRANVAIGKPIPGRAVVLLDDEDRPCPTGVTGNIVIRTPFVTPGYVGHAAGNTAPFRPVGEAAAEPAGPWRPGWYRTGDLGRRLPDGSYEFRGRKDFQVKLFGNRVELTEIEDALAAESSVAECAVVPAADSGGLVTRLVCHVVPREAGGGAPRAWRAHLRRRFGGIPMPLTFVVTGGPLPRNLAGKIDRHRLPPPPATADDHVPTPVETALAGLWAELLPGRPRAGADDTFFTAGGHSLLVPVLAAEIHRRFGTALSVWDLVSTPSLAGMAAAIEAGNGPAVRENPKNKEFS
ncbi:non-ribosomal peptide synthetase [Amycolatopsis sp. NPDC004747]